MKKIMFDDRFLLTKAVLDGRKTQTRRNADNEYKKTMKHYRIKHKPTGLYYQSPKNGDSLSEKGHVYKTKKSVLDKEGDFVMVSLKIHGEMFERCREFLPPHSGCYAAMPKADFEKEYVTGQLNRNSK